MSKSQPILKIQVKSVHLMENLICRLIALCFNSVCSYTEKARRAVISKRNWFTERSRVVGRTN